MGETNAPLKPLVIGVTGGIASGKSTVVEELARLGAMTLSADEVARRVTNPGGLAYNSMVKAFGNEIVLPDGQLDRAALAATVFSDPSERKRLESLLHPLIMEELAHALRAFRERPPNAPPIAVVEIPLLYEVGAESLVDRVLVISVEHSRQFHRLKQRTTWSDEVIQDAIDAQMPLSEKAARADDVITTDGSLEETLAQTRSYWNRISRPYQV